jgi:hypothetical protein
VVWVSPADQAPALLVARWRQNENQDRFGVTDLDLLGSIDLDFQDDVTTLADIWNRSSVVIAEEFGPLSKTVLFAVLLKSVASREYIRLIMLTGPLFSGRPRSTQKQRGISAQQGVNNGALTNATWTGDDQNQWICTRR